MQKIILILFIFSIINLHHLKAQRHAERNLILNPLLDTTKIFNGRKTSWAHSFNGWVSFNKYTFLKDADHEWYQQLGTMTEIVRFRNNSSLAFAAHIEMVADPNNNINLNPRAIFWEEGLFYIKKVKNHFLKLGYYHRCKHDIDNLEIGEERGTIFGSLLFEAIKPIQLPKSDLFIAIRTDFYTIRQDFRLPRRFNIPAPNVNNLTGSIRANFNYEKPINDFLGIFINGYSMLLIYSRNQGLLDRLQSFKNANINAGLSSGLAINGNANIRLAFNYEYLHDTGISINPVSGHLFSFGVMGKNPLTIR